MKLAKVYWIHSPTHTDPLHEGYIGITLTSGSNGRISSHFRKLKNLSHPNPKLQNAFNKHKNLICLILLESTVEACINEEIKLRPFKEIGWNILEGGGLPPNHKGLHWYNNGIINCFSVDCPEGFVSGKLQKSGKGHGHYGKKKLYTTVQPIKFKKGNVPWNKGKTGIPKLKIQCPYCKKEGGAPQMKQWHFEKCKEKNNAQR
jgi:hypothetical protein